MAKIKSKTDNKTAAGTKPVKLAAKKKLKPQTAIKKARTMVAPLHKLKTREKLIKAELKKVTDPLGEQQATFLELVSSTLKSGEDIVVSDGKNTIEVSKQRRITQLPEDLSDIIEHLEGVKKGLVLDILTFSLADLRQYISEEDLEGYCTVVGGARSVKYK